MNEQKVLPKRNTEWVNQNLGQENDPNERIFHLRDKLAETLGVEADTLPTDPAALMDTIQKAIDRVFDNAELDSFQNMFFEDEYRGAPSRSNEKLRKLRRLALALGQEMQRDLD